MLELERFYQPIEKLAEKYIKEEVWWDVHGDIPTIARYMAIDEVISDLEPEEVLSLYSLDPASVQSWSREDLRLLREATKTILRYRFCPTPSPKPA